MYGKWMYGNPNENNDLELQNFDSSTKNHEVTEPKTTVQARAVEEVKSITIDKKQQEDYVLLHNFEKVETAEEHDGNWRDFDGADDLEDHQDTLEELSMSQTVRVDDPVHSVYQADFLENTTVSESGEIDEKGFHIKYDEWDYKRNQYKFDFCKVYPKQIKKKNTEYYYKTITDYTSTLMGLRKMLTSVNNKMQQQRRMTYGEDLDIDAVNDLYTDVK